jgi:hypothetical protein
MRTLGQGGFASDLAQTVAFVGPPENMQKDWKKHALSASSVSNRMAQCDHANANAIANDRPTQPKWRDKDER